MRVVAPISAPGVSDTREGEGPAPVQSPVTLSATILSPSKSLSHVLPASSTGAITKQRKAYVHVIQSSGYNSAAAKGATLQLSAEDVTIELREGDGAYITSEEAKVLKIENIGDKSAEILLFDVE